MHHQSGKAMPNLIDAKIQEIVLQYGYDEQVLLDLVAVVQSQPKPRKSTSKAKSGKPKEPTMTELKAAVIAAFHCQDFPELKKHEAFNLAIAGRELNLRKKDGWLVLYREWVGVPENERQEEGPTCINGIDVLKNFRPWHVFQLDPKTSSTDDINRAFRQLAQEHHPDHGGNREVFERLQKMRDSLLAFR